MARLTIGQKAERVLKLLMGLRNPRVAAALAAHGFTEDDLREGWRMLAALTRQRLSIQVQVEDPHMIAQLDAFENKWFPIVRVALERHNPEVAEQLFMNLYQTEGAEVVVSVRTFLERIAQMQQGADPYGPSGIEARKLLERRGLTAERVAEAQQMLQKLGTFREEPQPEPSAEEQALAEQALWSWYLEWGGIARATLTDRRLLRSLGFLQNRRSHSDEAEDDSTEEDSIGEGETADITQPVSEAPSLDTGEEEVEG